MDKSPDAFRTISEVADWLDTPAHVLRFWESRFTQVKPIKRAGGRRYYRPADMALLGGIKKLLHDDGMTIRGVQKLLREHGVKYVASLSPVIEGVEPITAPPVTNSPIPPTPKRPEPVQLAVVETPPEPAQPAQETAQEPEPAPVRTPVPPAPMAEMVSQEDYEAELPEETVVPFSRSEPVSPDTTEAQPESDAPEVAAEAEVAEVEVAEAPVFTAHTEETTPTDPTMDEIAATTAPTEPEPHDPPEMPIAMDEAEADTYASEAMTESLFDMTDSSEADEADSMAEQATFDFDLSESFADHDPDPTLVETDEAELPADAPLAAPTEAEAPATPERLPLGAALDLPEDPEDTAPEITPAASVLGQLDHRKLMTMPTDEITALVARIETLRARLAS
ncbi:MerR family transcriptional regulator [Celeribacter halophilus]|uniref:MerR family transcriptional regulator n=1 Tax=Celeribacter halophilus TaxID=576117 RepID=UPI003A915E22